VGVANVLNEEKKQQVLALGRLGWPLRKIQQATCIRRETVSQCLKAAGIAVRPPGGWGRRAAKRANQAITDFPPRLWRGKTGHRGDPRPQRQPQNQPRKPFHEGKATATAKPANEVITDSEVITDLIHHCNFLFA
jgi:hypothetical protein